MKPNEITKIISAAEGNEKIMNALVEVFAKSTYNGGQHDLINCRICHNEQNWHTGIMTHKDDCPVGKVRALLNDFYKECEKDE